jgi:hypothetical protein
LIEHCRPEMKTLSSLPSLCLVPELDEIPDTAAARRQRYWLASATEVAVLGVFEVERRLRLKDASCERVVQRMTSDTRLLRQDVSQYWEENSETQTHLSTPPPCSEAGGAKERGWFDGIERLA